MKKVFIAIFALAAVVVTSCNNEKKTEGDFTKVESALGDSLATSFGKMQGAQALNNYKRYEQMMTPEQQKNFKKEEFLKGLELVLTTDTANIAYLNGIQQGLQMYGIFMDKGLGVPVDAKVIIKAFTEVYNRDTLDQITTSKYNNEFQDVFAKVQELASKKAEAEAKETPEAKENIAAGEKYIAEKVAEGYTKTASGLAYKINNEGEGEKVKPTDIVRVKYVGTHVNGEEFDRSMGDEPTRMSVAGLVKGFQEGLALLGKGGSATIIVPGDLAYGAMGRGPIGKMETLVFEITVDDIETPGN